MNLDRTAIEEFAHMLKHRRGDTVWTETPPFRGGTQDLCDAGLIDYLRDTGLKTYYTLTQEGITFAVTAQKKPAP